MKILWQRQLILSIALGLGILLTFSAGAYADNHEEKKMESDLPAPQLVTDAWMFLVSFKADPEVVKSLLPEGLEPHPDHSIVMNMYTVPDANQTSGFGDYNLTYLTVELKNNDSYVMGQDEGYPGRYFIRYYNSSEKVRNFTKPVGIPAEPGKTTQTVKNGKLNSTLEVEGKPFIEVTADVGDEILSKGGGHLNYFGLVAEEKDGKKVQKVMKYPIPFVGGPVKTENVKINFVMPEDHPLRKLQPKEIKWAVWMKASFVYPQAQMVHESMAKN